MPFHDLLVGVDLRVDPRSRTKVDTEVNRCEVRRGTETGEP